MPPLKRQPLAHAIEPGPWNNFGCVKFGDSAGSLPNRHLSEAPVLSSPAESGLSLWNNDLQGRCIHDESHAYYFRFPQLLWQP
jgi:hypothetical protein